MSLEAAKLLECFQWSGEDVWINEKTAHVVDELADILIYAVQFAAVIGLDIPTIILEKLKHNGLKYSVNRYKHCSDKELIFHGTR